MNMAAGSACLRRVPAHRGFALLQGDFGHKGRMNPKIPHKRTEPTWDLYDLGAEKLLGLLPSDFDEFKS